MGEVKKRMINYNVHGILKVETNIEIPEIIPPFFETGEAIAPDLIIKAGQFTPTKEGFYREFQFLGQRLRIMIGEPAQQTKLFFSFRYMPFIPPQIIRLLLFKSPSGLSPGVLGTLRGILQLKFLERGYSLIHGACLSKGREGILLVAPGNIGKTYTTVLLARKGFGYLSDDMTITDGNKVYCYPTPVTIARFHLERLQLTIGAKESLKMTIKHLAERIPLLQSDLAVCSLFPQELGMNIIKEVDITKLYFLEEGEDEIKKLKREEAVRRIVTAGRMHISLLENQYILSYLYSNENRFLSLVDEWREIYERLIDKVECYLLKSRDKRFGEMILDCEGK